MACSYFEFSEKSCTAVNIGFDFSKTLTFTDNDGLPIDLTGYLLAGEIKNSLGGNTLISLPEVSDSQTTGLYIADRTTGIIEFQIKLADTSQTEFTFPYEITITDPATDINLFLHGTIQFTGDF